MSLSEQTELMTVTLLLSSLLLHSVARTQSAASAESLQSWRARHAGRQMWMCRSAKIYDKDVISVDVDVHAA
jgi:hypothetical protein